MNYQRYQIARGLIAILIGSTLASGGAIAQSQQANDDQEVIKLPAFSITENKDVGYVATNAFSATRVATSSMEIPQAIGVINREFIEDIGAQTVLQAARYISGVSFGNNSAADINLIRGLNGRGANWDGFGPETGEMNPDTISIERIEIIKGPIGLLIGGSTGGAINLITKSPLARPQNRVGVQIGRFNANRLEFDTTGPVNDSGSFLYRVAGAYQNSEGFRDFTFSKRIVIAPSFTYRFSPSAQFTVKFEATDDDWGFDVGSFISPFTNKLIDIPRERALTEDDPINYRREPRYRLHAELTSRLNAHWSTRLALHGTWSYVDRFLTNLNGASLDANGNIQRSITQASFDLFNGAIQNDYVGEFEVGPTKHKMLLGWEYGRFTQVRTALAGNAGPINVYNPVFGQRPFSIVPLSNGLFDASDRNNVWKILARDQINLLSDKLILVGGYYEIYNETKNVRKLDRFILASSTKTSGGQLGAIYRITPDYSLYYGYNDFKGVVPAGTDSFGNPFRAPVRSQDEFGLKAMFLNQRVSITVAYFDILQDGLLVNDANFPGYSIQRGIETSKGWEVDINASPNDNLQLIASYSDTDARQVSGVRVFGSPKNMANAFALYRFTGGAFKGWSLGTGVNYVSERSGDNANSFQLDAYTIANALVRYEKGHWRYTLNIDNVFDKEYEPNSAGRNNVYIGDPTNLRLSIDYSF